MRKIIICLWSIVALFGMAKAQSKEPFLRTKVQFDTIGINEVLRLEYVFENVRSVNFSNPIFEGFDIVQGPFQSSQFSLVNGVSTSSSTYTYILKATSLGVFTIAPQMVYLDNNSYLTPEAAVVIVQENLRKNNNNFNNLFDMPSLGFNEDVFERMQQQSEEMMKRHRELFDNPDGFFNRPDNFLKIPRHFGPDFNDMFKNFDNLFQFKMPPLTHPKKPEERTYKL